MNEYVYSTNETEALAAEVTIQRLRRRGNDFSVGGAKIE